MLLKGIAVNRIVQKKREVRIQIEERPADKPVRFEGVTVRPRFAVVTRKGSEPYSSATRRIDVAESIDEARVDEVKRNLARRVKVVPPEAAERTKYSRRFSISLFALSSSRSLVNRTASVTPQPST